MPIELMSKKVIDVPEGLVVDISLDSIKIANDKATLVRKLPASNIQIEKDASHITLSVQHSRRRDLALLGTLSSHVANMIMGLTKGFEYILKLVYSHFPVTIKQDESKIIIENFLGERKPRVARIMEGAHVDISTDTIIVGGYDKEAVGQTAANLEKATKIKRRDPKVFQDGLYIVEKRCS